MRVSRFLVGLLLASTSTSAGAQRASQHATVSQTIDATTVTVDYYRPLARGRDSLFGRVVRPNETWTPGANWATTLDVDQDVKVNGHPLPKGKYSLWLIAAGADWTVIVNKDWKLYHIQPPKKERDALRFAAKPVTGGAFSEALTWDFPSLSRDAATLRMRWGTTELSLEITAEPQPVLALGPGQRAIYLGDYDIKMMVDGGPPGAIRFTVIDSAGGLYMRGPAFDPSIDGTSQLLPLGNHRFVPLFFTKGVVLGAEPDAAYVFTFSAGRVVGLEMRDQDEKLIGQGKRVSAAKP